MTPVCTCKKPDVKGTGEQQYCVKCGAWTQAALDANAARKRRERDEETTYTPPLFDPLQGTYDPINNSLPDLSPPAPEPPPFDFGGGGGFDGGGSGRDF